MDSVEEKLKDIFTTLFTLSKDEIRPESSPETIQTWDSVQNLHMIMEIEETFGISITEDDVERMKTFSDVAKVIQNHLGK